MRRFARYCLLALLPIAAVAQTEVAQSDGRDYLTALLEDNLSTVGRNVTITGFTGALSSQAHLDSLTIADGDGVWLTLDDVALDWNRADLLTGRVTVNSLTAAEIYLDRLPTADESIKAEASSFKLPELPVSVEIGTLLAEKLILGAPVFGEQIETRIELSMNLVGGQGAGKLSMQRIDGGPDADISLEVDYANATEHLNLNLTAAEDQGGIVTKLMGIPNAPKTNLNVQGSGPISDFSAQLDLTSDGQPRLGGTVTLTGNTEQGRSFGADVSGNMAPLFAPEYRAFFGDQVALSLGGVQRANGEMDISNLNLTASALTLNGSLALAADGLPKQFDLTGRISAPAGRSVLLPLTTDIPVNISGADITARFDAAMGNTWTAQINANGIDREDMQIAALQLGGTGKIARADSKRQVDAKLTFTGEGLSPRDAALADALGSIVWGDADLKWTQGDGAVTLTSAHVTTDTATADISGTLTGLSDGFTLDGMVLAELDDLSRFSALAKRDLSGAAQATLIGKGTLLTGAFDMGADVTGSDLGIGIAQLDGPLAGVSRIALTARRDVAGITLRDMTLTAQGVSGQMQGNLSAAGSRIDGTLALPSLAVLGGKYRGAVKGKFAFDGTPTAGKITVDATADGLAMGQTQVDTLTRGTSILTANLALADGALRLDQVTLKNPALDGTVKGIGPAADLRFDINAQIRNLGVVLPQFPGPLSLKGTAVSVGVGQNLDFALRGPGQLNGTVKGYFDAGTANDLHMVGTAQAGLINTFIQPRSLSGNAQFDLRLRGALETKALNGTVSLAAGRISDPALPFALQGIAAKANIANGTVQLNGETDISVGGHAAVKGSATLTEPFDGDLDINITALHLRDPDLYDTTVNGKLRIAGPLRSGALITGTVDLGKTELQVPSSSFRSTAALPDLRHLGDTAPVRETRARAGIAQSGKTAVAASFGLDLVVRAPSRVFIRGRGLDAELGGELRLQGTTNDVRPAGAFNLIQGRFEILGKRLDLEEVLLQLEGQLVPFISIRATTTNADVTSIVEIEGPAIDPDVTFTSTPELPQEEVLAQLLFGQKIQNLSALQGIQLASAIATLAGRGNGGIVARVRGALALDNLDIQSDATGATTLRAGKYVSDKVYTEVTIGPSGQHEINLNLDVSKTIKLHSGLAADGNASIGVVIEKNY